MSTQPGAVVALRYMTTIVDGRLRLTHIPELCLPEYGVLCNAWRSQLRAFHHPIRNEVRQHWTDSPRETEVERFELPKDLAFRVLELADLTRRQQALAAEIREELTRITPLDTGDEFTALLQESLEVEARGADAIAVARLVDTAKQLSEDWTVLDSAMQMRALRRKLAALPVRK